MRSVLQCYDAAEPEVHLAVDSKMKVLERGHGVATLSILLKDRLRNTTLTHGAGQGPAHTTRAAPFLQAVFSDEGTPNHVRLFRLACDLWSEAQPESPPLADLVTQVHKDFAPGIEAARKEVFPRSRPCDDYFHFKQKRKTLESKCREVVTRNGRTTKKNTAWIASALGGIRFAPTLPLFSSLWVGLLQRLAADGEPDVRDWLLQYLPTDVGEAAGPHSHFSSLWVGAQGMWPGTGSGNEPAESVHSVWQRQLESLGGKVHEALMAMQALYTKSWCHYYDWDSVEPLRTRFGGSGWCRVRGSGLKASMLQKILLYVQPPPPHVPSIISYCTLP